jgi:nucleotide-binding universal stress UspA family protein
MQSPILVAHDFSPCSQAAAREAVRDAARSGDPVVLLHVFSVLPMPPAIDSAAAAASLSTTAELEHTLEVELTRQLERIADDLRAEAPGVQFELAVREGSTAECILDEAERRHAQRVVVGTHGRTGLAHLLLGSTAERVARLSKVPVLIVKEPKAA